jgi:hypothetical protein
MKPRHFNFQFSIFNFIVLALLFVGCTKEEENADRINIFSEGMNANGSKVFIPSNNDGTPNANGATWVAGESVNLNGTLLTITSDGDGRFSLPVAPLSEMMYAVYPATTASGGDTITVTNNNASGTTITIKSLAVDFRDGGHRIIFPMAAKADANSGSLLFNHLTGALRLTLANSSNSGIVVDHLKVVVQGTAAAPTVTRNEVNYTVRWEVQGPTMPSGDVGISGDLEVSYSSEMYFNMQTSGNAGVTVPANGSISFCVPVTVNHVKRISITGYDASGVQLFSKVKELDSFEIKVNHMYNIPLFNINNN